MKLMKPVRHKPIYYKDIEERVNEIFWKGIYAPLVEIINKNNIKLNSKKTRLEEAISTGKISYDGQSFTGSFSATVSKQLKALGAEYSSKTKSFFISKPSLPTGVIGEIEIVKQKMISMHSSIIEALKIENVEKALEEIDLYNSYAKTIGKVDVDWKDAAKAISIVPELTEAMRENLSIEYVNDMHRYIKGWSKENITSLREMVQANMSSGARANTLAKKIMKNYNVSQSKALFLAKQETSLLLVQYNNERRKNVGITKFKWSTSGDNRVRGLHKDYNGKVFDYENPPIINEKTGERGLPGQAYGCRCVAINIITE